MTDRNNGGMSDEQIYAYHRKRWEALDDHPVAGELREILQDEEFKHGPTCPRGRECNCWRRSLAEAIGKIAVDLGFTNQLSDLEVS